MRASRLSKSKACKGIECLDKQVPHHFEKGADETTVDRIVKGETIQLTSAKARGLVPDRLRRRASRLDI